MVALSGTFQSPDGAGIANGTLVISLSQAALVEGTSWISPTRIFVTLNNIGQIPGGVSVYGLDVLTPAEDLVYSYFVLNAIGSRVIPPTIFIPTGSSYNFNS